MRKLLTILTVLTLFFSLGTNATAKSINLNQTSTILTVGTSTNLKISGVKKSKIKWKSSNPSIATVKPNGMVIGKKVGKTTITGIYNKVKFKCNVTVVAKKLNKTLYNGNDCKIVLTGVQKNGLSFKVLNKKTKDVNMSLEYVTLDGNYYESEAFHLLPSKVERSFRISKSISNFGAKYMTARFGIWNADTGFIIKYISIGKTKIR